MPEFRTGCPERLPSLTHDHTCYLEQDHGSGLACFCGFLWDAEGRISIRKLPRYR
jgi:hypothetical protein